ncbi:MAG: hypothetical protein AAF702_42410 [Chloroflexota bacterium]
MSGRNAHGACYLLGLASSQQDWGNAPDVSLFYGRQAELASLSSWLVADRCRLVAILGMGEQGKTALVAKLVHEIAAWSIPHHSLMGC